MWKSAAELRQRTEIFCIPKLRAKSSFPALTAKGLGISIWWCILLFLHPVQLTPMMNLYVSIPTLGLIHLWPNHFLSVCLLAESVCEISPYCLVLQEMHLEDKDHPFAFTLPLRDQWISGYDFKNWCCDSFSQHDGEVSSLKC